jgi:hypothetical protein
VRLKQGIAALGDNLAFEHNQSPDRQIPGCFSFQRQRNRTR